MMHTVALPESKTMTDLHRFHQALSDLVSETALYINTLHVDSNTILWFQYGLVVGLVIVTTFTLFPGEPTGLYYGSSEPTTVKSDDQIISTENDTPKPKEKISPIPESSEVNPSSTNTAVASHPVVNVHTKTPKEIKSKSNRGVDAIPIEKIELVRKMMGLTKDQMAEAVKSARKEQHGRNSSITKEPLPRRSRGNSGSYVIPTLNFLVYASAFGALIFIMNRDHPGAFISWLVSIFPKEAETLGVTATATTATQSQ